MNKKPLGGYLQPSWHNWEKKEVKKEEKKRKKKKKRKKNSAKSYRTSDFIGCPNNCTEWLWGKKGRDSKTKTLAKQVWLEGSWTIWPSVKWSLASMSWSQSVCFTGMSPECRFENFRYCAMTHLNHLCTSSTEIKE